MFAAFVILPLFFFALFPTLSLARTVVVAPSDTKSINYFGTGFELPPAVTGSSAGAERCPGISSAAIASVPGASFTFTFNGTAVSLSTRTGPGEASFRVTRDGEVDNVNPVKLGSQPCFLSYSSPVMEYGEHSITVLVTDPGEMALLSIIYETGDQPIEEKKQLSTTVTIIIAVCCVAGLLAIFGAVFLLCCRRNRRAKSDVETASLRYKNNGHGLLTTTPTFVQYPTEKKDFTHRFSDDKAAASDRSASPKPSTIQPYRPYSPPRKPLPVYGVQTNNTRTTGATETAFSV